MRPAKIEVFRDRSKHWRYRIKAANGEITEQSQAYSTKGNAVRAAKKRGKYLMLEVAK